MKIIGLTGSIGMGKSTTAGLFRDQNIPVFDSDKSVHILMAAGGRAVEKISEIFPEALKKTSDDIAYIDRSLLSRTIFKTPKFLKKLEEILHPMVAEDRENFLKKAIKDGQKIVLFDIPLLFETGAEKYCDHIVVVTAPAEVQKKRVLERPGMTKEKFNLILKKQTPDEIKRQKADFIIFTHLGVEAAATEITKILQQIKKDMKDIGK